MRIAHSKSGFSLMEILISLSAITLVIFGMTSVLVHSSRASDRTQSQSQVDTDVALAVEKVQSALNEARSVTIDSNGLGITYKRPATDSSGNYTFSLTATESASHRLYVADGELYSSDSPNRPILTDIPATDPDTNTTLRVFSVGINNREIKVRLVSKRTNSDGCEQYSAITTRIRPKNMP